MDFMELVMLQKLDLLNASQYAMLANENVLMEEEMHIFQILMPGSWYRLAKLIFNSAARTSHDISVSGGNDKSTFFGSFGYYNQEGIVMRDISNYKRITARLNSSHKVFPFLTVGQTLNYTHVKSQGINSER